MPPLLPMWQWKTSSGVSSGGFVTPYFALNSSGSSVNAASTVSTERNARKAAKCFNQMASFLLIFNATHHVSILQLCAIILHSYQYIPMHFPIYPYFSIYVQVKCVCIVNSLVSCKILYFIFLILMHIFYLCYISILLSFSLLSICTTWAAVINTVLSYLIL